MRTKIALLTALLLLIPLVSYSDDAKLITAWEPPTTKVANNDCNQAGTAITPEELDVIEYTLSYRIKDSGDDWTNIETMNPAAEITGLLWNTTYELAVGAHWANGAVLCASDMIEATTSLKPAPGGCSNFTVLNQ